MTPVATQEQSSWAGDAARGLLVLTTRQSSALRLIYGQGLLQSEVAAQLGLSSADIGAAVSQGLDALGRSLRNGA